MQNTLPTLRAAEDLAAAARRREEAKCVKAITLEIVASLVEQTAIIVETGSRQIYTRRDVVEMMRITADNVRALKTPRTEVGGPV